MIRSAINKQTITNKARKAPLIVSMGKEGLMPSWSVYRPITPWFMCRLVKNPFSGADWLSGWYVSMSLSQPDGNPGADYHPFNADSALFLTAHYCALFEKWGYLDANTQKGRGAVFQFIYGRINAAIPSCIHDLSRLGYPTKLNH